MGFDSRSEFSFRDASAGKKFIIFETDMSSSVHVLNKKYIIILGKGQELDHTTLTAETKYPINFTLARKKFVLNLQYNRSNSSLFANVL